MIDEISEIDKTNYALIRKNVSEFIFNCAKRFDNKDVKVLDIAPQVHLGAKEYFKLADVKTLDIDSISNADYIADICNCNDRLIPNKSFDIIICTEVLEHTANPFSAIKELARILKNGGYICASTPFNFRIHGPLPDCWRFTEHGLRELIKSASLKLIEVNALDTPERFLMPIHYTFIGKKID
ncbi:MAG: methyltransferase domain-containing protein [Ignavibacteriaceae bacterium]|jgi:ubiquinone/menaquinone biosynthesis C-methylase UbiE